MKGLLNMKSRLKYFILFLAVIFCLSPYVELSANETLTQEDFVYKVYESSKSGKYISIEKYNGKNETLVIPETINGIPVTTISGLDYYRYPEKIKKIVLSKNVNNVEYWNFEKLTSLESIEVDKENSKYYAKKGVLFQEYKNKITLVFYPCAKNGKTYTVSSDVDAVQMAFLNNKYLRTLTIKAKVSHLYEIAAGSNIETINLPSSVKFIDEYAFRGCSKLKKIKFGDKVETIGREAFDGCDSLKTITIPNSVYKIHKDGFDGCSAKIKKASYLKKQKDGSYLAKAKIGKKEYTASSITKISPAQKSYTLKKGKVKKLKTTAYVNKKKKGTLSTTAMLSYKSSNKKVLTVSKYGNMKGRKKGKATVTVNLKTKKLSYKVKVTVK